MAHKYRSARTSGRGLLWYEPPSPEDVVGQEVKVHARLAAGADNRRRRRRRAATSGAAQISPPHARARPRHRPRPSARRPRRAKVRATVDHPADGRRSAARRPTRPAASRCGRPEASLLVTARRPTLPCRPSQMRATMKSRDERRAASRVHHPFVIALAAASRRRVRRTFYPRARARLRVDNLTGRSAPRKDLEVCLRALCAHAARGTRSPSSSASRRFARCGAPAAPITAFGAAAMRPRCLGRDRSADRRRRPRPPPPRSTQRARARMRDRAERGTACSLGASRSPSCDMSRRRALTHNPSGQGLHARRARPDCIHLHRAGRPGGP